MKRKLHSIAANLLDLGKRNRLLNYKNTGYRTINILNDNIEEVFDKIVDSNTYTLYNLEPSLKKYHEDLVMNAEGDETSYSELRIKDIFLPVIGKKDLLAYKQDKKLSIVLRAIYKEYKLSLIERGINSLYITFGMVNYTEDGNKYSAPALLIPVEFIHKNNEYKVKEYEDEVIFNPTLQYYLKTVKKIIIPDYNDEPINEYFEMIKSKLLSDMSFENKITLGIYSFLKMNMYSDLINNTDEVIKNTNIRRLLGESIPNDENERNTIYPVVDCDSSQTQAITLAAQGKSFVLEGPPGSGKSQTITNIIATLIANNKKVLFVSQKLAALNVVYENLKRCGLDDFAALLHSHKANKKEFIDDLYESAVKPKYEINRSVSEIQSNYDIQNTAIEVYQNEVNKNVVEMGISLYELYSKYLSVECAPLKFEFDKEIKHSSYKEATETIKEFVDLSKDIAYDYRKCAFYGLKELSSNYIRFELDEDLTVIIRYLEKLSEIKFDINSTLDSNIVNIYDVYNSIDLVDKLLSVKTYHEDYLVKEKREKLAQNLEKFIKLQSSILESQKLINKHYFDEVYTQNLKEIYDGLRSFNHSVFKCFNSEYKRYKRQALLNRKSKAKHDKLVEEFNVIYELGLQKNQYENEKASILNTYGGSAGQVLEDLNKLSFLTTDYQVSREKFVHLKKELTDVFIAFNSYAQENDKLVKFFDNFDKTIVNPYNYSIEDLILKFKELKLIKDKIKTYNTLMGVVNHLNDLNCLDFIDFALDEAIGLDDILVQFDKQYYLSKIYAIIDENPILSGFSSSKEDSIISEFIDIDEKYLQANKAIVFANCSKNRPDDSVLEGTQFATLIKEHNKLRKQKPIRMLLDEIFDTALRIKPIFLMSPLSVSTYISGKVNQFDCVIFDEASQVFAYDAFGAIYRAKQCIIIGDTKQMPPSNFFGAISEAEDEEDYEDNLQSILDSAQGMLLTSRLKWHYRSRNEDLIRFSNQNFYDDNLITIPQAEASKDGFGVDFVYLSDGRYDVKSRTNRKEAEAICNMVFEHYKNSSQSLGVVAFSNVQAELIESLVYAKVHKYPELAHYFDDSEYEPFFVKNLETVQGDERDRIIFSICYGYNENNKFYQRFGPLNNVGGERRLNVAITRAKYNVTVVSSIKYTDIETKNTESVGVKMLKDYLEFAEHHSSVNAKNILTDDGVANDICKELQKYGYETTTNVGASKFKIDIVVSKNGKNLLAIMLDKKAAFSDSNRDKFRLIKTVLERLGWKLHRVYSTAWINDQSHELSRLLDVLKENTQVEETQTEEVLVNDLIISTENNLDGAFIQYEEFPFEQIEKTYQKYGMVEVIHNIVEHEGPIHEQYLLKKLSRFTKSGRITVALKDEFYTALEKLNCQKQREYLYYGNIDNIKLRLGSERTIEQIHTNELQYGIMTIVKENNGITKAGCFKALVKKLGFSKITDKTTAVLEDALIFLKLDGKVVERGECLFI